MKLNVWECEMCGNEYRGEEKLASVRFHVDNDSDPADGHNLKCWATVDLCPGCQHGLLDSAINDHPMEWRRKVAAAWKAKR